MIAAPLTGVAPEDRIARRRSLPAGGEIGMIAMRDGWPLRTAWWPGPAGGPGSILFLNGRGDFIEKYAETFHDLLDAGWGVASFDWRGQGLSGRLGDAPMKGHSPGFDNWRADLVEVIGWFEARAPGPRFSVAHSQGGHLLLRHLAVDAGRFARAVLLSPMLGVVAPRGARLVARAMVLAGRGGDYVRGGGPYVPGLPGSARQLLLTHDADRYGDEGWWVDQQPALAMGSVTWGWLDAAFRSLAAQTSLLARTSTPLLILVPDHDGLVDNDATRRVAAALPAARLEVVPGAAHELLREADPVRTAVLARVIDFLGAGV